MKPQKRKRAAFKEGEEKWKAIKFLRRLAQITPISLQCIEMRRNICFFLSSPRQRASAKNWNYHTNIPKMRKEEFTPLDFERPFILRQRHKKKERKKEQNRSTKPEQLSHSKIPFHFILHVLPLPSPYSFPSLLMDCPL
ncbi:hypothetical protein TNCV_439651 [Trichonephila clavipes]|nr:hypothetical protein TNCV_439651 [Trichonephila clavipes]